MGKVKYKGVIIAEGLEESSIINEFEVYRAEISKDEEDIDYESNKGRWHSYWVYATEKQIEYLVSELKQGWYAHFWLEDKIIAVFKNKKFEFLANDKSTWKDVVEYGKSVKIREEQLDFPTE